MLTLKKLLKTSSFNTFLVDAAGVIYIDKDKRTNPSETFAYLQNTGPTFLATNNSYSYTSHISEQLSSNFDIQCSVNQIISSGQGLAQDPNIIDILTNKVVYFLGKSSSKHYALDAPIKGITHNLNLAEVIILANFSPENKPHTIQSIINTCINNPSLPIICCNPDIHIRLNQTFLNVMGFYAKQIEKNIKRPLIWYGKPYENFSILVKNSLSKHSLTCSKNTLFFDDNLNNVTSMQRHLNISGCWIKKTGIQCNISESELINEYGHPTFSINAFGLNERVTKYLH